MNNSEEETNALKEELNNDIFWLKEVGGFDYDTILDMWYTKFNYWVVKKSKLEENKRKKEEQMVKEHIEKQRRDSDNKRHLNRIYTARNRKR